MAFFCDVEKQRRTRISKMLLNRSPELHLGSKIVAGNCSYTEITQQITYTTENNKPEIKQKQTTVIYYDPSKQDGRCTSDIFEVLRTLKLSWSGNGNKKQRTIVAPFGLKTDIFRKIAEIIFHNSDTVINIITTKTNSKNIPNKKPSDDVVIIRSNSNSTYADTLKKLTKGLEKEELVSNVKNAKKTKKGEILLKLKLRKRKNAKNY